MEVGRASLRYAASRPHTVRVELGWVGLGAGWSGCWGGCKWRGGEGVEVGAWRCAKVPREAVAPLAAPPPPHAGAAEI